MYNIGVIYGSRTCEHDVSIISALQAAQAHKREAERQAGEKAQQILSRAREQAEEIQRGAEAEAGRLADALRERADARGAEAIDAVKRLLFA